MVSNEELLELANNTIKNLYEEFKNYDDTSNQTKEDILLEEFEENLIFEEFFRDLLVLHKGKEENYKKYVADFSVVLIEENKGKINITELVDIFNAYEKDEQDDFINKKEEKTDIIEDEDDDLDEFLNNIPSINFNDLVEFDVISNNKTEELSKIDPKVEIFKEEKKGIVFVPEKSSAPTVKKKESSFFKKKK